MLSTAAPRCHISAMGLKGAGMIEGADGLGEAVTGGLVARAIEPSAGEATGDAAHAACLNCGTLLVGRHCHECGQAGHVHRTVSAWWHDLAHSVLHFDGKLWRTLPLLAWRPGELTRRYIDGERARFVSPMALFLFTVFLMFAIFSLLGATAAGLGQRDPNEQAAAIADADRRISTLEAQRRAATDQRAIAGLDEALTAARVERRLVAVGVSEEQLTDNEIDTGWPRLDHALKKANENPALLFYKLQANAYKFSWALIPLSLPLLWLLFLHRRRYRARFKAYDHLVFITYSISFMSMALIAMVLLGTLGIPAGIVVLTVLIVPPVHIFRQLRGAYGLNAASALWRTAALIVIALLTSALFLMLLLALGLLA
jgi:hypothetical protein